MALVWEELTNQQKTGREAHPGRLSRAKVPGGWLIYVWDASGGTAIAFYPEPAHVWDGSSAP